jgi:predicted DNA-binding transcriptional regulator YafY
VIEGIVLEFSHPEELLRLRRQPNLRRHVEQILSPRHILVSTEQSKTLFQMLKRRGVYVSLNEKPPDAPKKRTYLPQKQQVVQPVGKSVPKLALLEKYLQLQQAIDVLYRAPGFPAEQRRITPLVIGQRGEHTYVIAFCQTRRARRLFRLDRMEIPGTY